MPMAMEMVHGKLSKRPPTSNTEITAAMPAPMIMPALIAGGTRLTTRLDNPVAPSPIQNTPSNNWNAISACTRASPSGKLAQ